MRDKDRDGDRDRDRDKVRDRDKDRDGDRDWNRLRDRVRVRGGGARYTSRRSQRRPFPSDKEKERVETVRKPVFSQSRNREME